MMGKPELSTFILKEMLASTRLVVDLGLLLIILGLEDDLPPFSIILLNHTLELALLRQDILIMKVLQHPLKGLVIVFD